MKKVLLISILLSGICLADTSYAEHEAQMNQMRAQTQSADGSSQKRQYQYGKSSGEQAGSGSSNQYKGSKRKGGGGQR